LDTRIIIDRPIELLKGGIGAHATELYAGRPALRAKERRAHAQLRGIAFMRP
jgi:hypothetical protein